VGAKDVNTTREYRQAVSGGPRPNGRSGRRQGAPSSRPWVGRIMRQSL